jgi:hypothetical protein
MSESALFVNFFCITHQPSLHHSEFGCAHV